MQKTDAAVVVSIQGAVVRIVAMGSNQHIGRLYGGLAQQANYYGRVVPIFAIKGELNHISRQKLTNRSIDRYRACCQFSPSAL